MSAMRVFGFAGWSGSGKTTLIERLIPRLVARGLTVSLVKHAHHEFDIDQPGKDSWRHREAGASELSLNFCALTGIRPMVETYPLEQAAAAYDRMLSGKARFRVVLTTGR